MTNSEDKALKRLWGYVVKRFNELPKVDEDDAVQMLMDMDIVQPVSDKNNVVYTDSKGRVFIL